MNETLAESIIVSNSSVEILRLKNHNQEVITYFKNIEPDERAIQAQKALEIGVLVLSRINATQATEFFNTKITELLSNVKTYFYQFDQTMKDLLVQNLDPGNSGSFLAKTQGLINSQVERVNSSLLEVIRDVRNILTNEASKIQIGRESLDKKMDPTNSGGYLSILIQKMNDFERQLASQFSETDRASFVGKLKQAVSDHFGEDGKVIQLIDQKLMVDIDGKSPLGQIYTGLKHEIASLRDAVMKVAGQQELINSTTKKGYPFEDQVFEELQKISHPFGDIVDNTSLKVEAVSGSKKGDYVYHITDLKQSIVIDAKNYNKLKSLTSMIEYLKEAIQERNSKFGIIVAPSIDSLQKQIGSWNVYENCIITPLDSLEISIKYAKYVMQFQETSTQNANHGIIKQKLSTIERKMKEVSTLKSKLTKLSNGIVSSITDIQDGLESLRQDIQASLQEISFELNK